MTQEPDRESRTRSKSFSSSATASHPSKSGSSGSAEPLRPEVAPNPEGGHQ
jgi:hypothetical protein